AQQVLLAQELPQGAGPHAGGERLGGTGKQGRIRHGMRDAGCGMRAMKQPGCGWFWLLDPTANPLLCGNEETPIPRRLARCTSAFASCLFAHQVRKAEHTL